MTKSEKQIIHGLYFGATKNLTETHKYRAGEILWLVNTKIPETAKWRMDNGGLQWFEPKKSNDYLVDISKEQYEALIPLAYLKSTEHITLEENQGMFVIGLTGKGAQLARDLDTWYGRFNIWYKEHKEGVFGILITVCVSALTAFIVTKLGLKE